MSRSSIRRYMRAGFALALALALAIAASVACRQIVGIDDRSPDATVPPPPDTAPSCGTMTLPATCQACVATQCCEQGRACSASTTCQRYENCLGKCAGDAACRSQCVIDTRWLVDDTTRAFDVCLAQHCGDQCKLNCGGQSYVASPEAAIACEGCLTSGACEPMQACAADADCQRLGWCRLGCRASDCSTACDDPAAPGATLWSGVLRAIGKCSGDCRFGGYWACAGKFAWPQAKADTLHVTGVVQDYIDPKKRVPDVTVTACLVTDVGCAKTPPLAVATTDSNGEFLFDLPTAFGKGARGFDGYFQFKGGGINPQIVFFAPLTEPKFRIVASTLTPDGFDTIAGLVGICSTCTTKVDPERGHLTVLVTDCFQNVARDVEVFASGADKDTVRAYIAGPVPSRDATMTDVSGLVVFLNMPVGPTTITIRPKGFAVVGTRTVFIRKGLFTAVYLGPTP